MTFTGSAISSMAVSGSNKPFEAVSSPGNKQPISIILESKTIPVPSVMPRKGLNYMSAWHLYDPKYTTDEILDRDFNRFKNDGINYIDICLYWYRLEGNTQGDFYSSNKYGDAFLKNVRRIIETADRHNIKVMVTISTLWGSDSPWCTPDYVIDPVTGENQGLAVVRSPEMHQAFLNMFSHTVNYLKGTKGIWCWALNEPWYYPSKLQPPYENIDQKENFISLFQEMKSISASLDGRPFTIQFLCAHPWGEKVFDIFSNDWQWDPRIFEATDFISFSANPPSDTGLFDKWKPIVRSNVTRCHQKGEKVWIAQTSSVGDNAFQIDKYGQIFQFMKTLPLEGIMPWQWRSDSFHPEWSVPGTGSNLCLDSTTGEGRPAYYLFVNEFKAD